MAGFHSASEYIKTSLVLVCLIGGVIAVAYGAPYWTTRYDGHAGLWHGCSWGICYERWDMWTSSWIKASQAFMTLAVIFIFFAGVLLFFFVFHKACEDDKRLVFFAEMLTGGTSVWTLLAVINWAAGEHFGSGEILNWPYALACAACIASVITTIFLHMEMKRPVK